MENSKRNEKTLVKSVSICIIISVIVAAIIGLGLLFNIIKYSDIFGNVLLSLLTVFIAGLLLLNSINAITSGNKLGIFAAFMIILSAVLFFVLIWGSRYLGTFGEGFNYAIVIVSMTSILLDVIVGHYIRLKSSLIAVQIVMYLAFAYIETAISFAILGNGALISFWQIFVTAIIVTVTLYFVLMVKEKNVAQDSVKEKIDGEDEFVSITKTEYENLKAEIERLKTAQEQNKVIVPPVGTGNIVQ